MRKIPYHRELLKTVASLFSPNTPSFEPGTDNKPDNASVTALVKTTLLYHRSTRTMDITVETKDGVVKLEGKARSWDEKNQVSKRVIDVPGVKMVFNNMSIERIESITNEFSSCNIYLKIQQEKQYETEHKKQGGRQDAPSER